MHLLGIMCVQYVKISRRISEKLLSGSSFNYAARTLLPPRLRVKYGGLRIHTWIIRPA